MRGYPQEVLRRFGGALPAHIAERRADGVTVDRRSFVPLASEGERSIAGYATVWDASYRVGGELGWDEVVKRGSTTKTLREQNIPLLVNHDCETALGVPLATTRAGSLRLTEDDVGLRVEADLGDDWISQAMHARIRDGVVDGMSIGFRCVRDEWDADYTSRVIREIALIEVSVVTFPANPATSVTSRADDPDSEAVNEVVDTTASSRVSSAYAAAWLSAYGAEFGRR